MKLSLKRLCGKEIRIRRDLSVATASGLGYHYSAGLLDAGSVVYSFGIGDSIESELDLIRGHSVSVHAFDPTPPAARCLKRFELPPGFTFHPWAVAGEDGTLTLYPRRKSDGTRSDEMWTVDPDQADAELAIDVPAYTIASLMSRLGHVRVDLVKMDVEGAEYDALSRMLQDRVFPTQILVEFHHRFPGIGKQKTVDCLEALRSVGYRVIWVSSTGREVSLVRASTAN